MEEREYEHHGHEHHGHEHHGHEHHCHGADCSCGHSCNIEQRELQTKEKQVYLLHNLGCAHCAAQMEEKIRELPEVEDAVIIYATGQLQVVTNTNMELQEKFQEICSSVEAQVVVRKREEKQTHQEEIGHGTLSENKQDLVEIGIGAGLFAAGILLAGQTSVGSVVVLLLGYLVLGREILITALKHIGKGRIFDENFLMGIATVAAIGIGDYKEAVGVMLFYRIGELFEELAVARSRKQIMSAVDLRPETVSLIEENGDVREIPAQNAEIGITLLVRPGDRIPLDGVVIEGESRMDTSPVTGESVPVSVRKGDHVLSGCINTSGVLKIQTEKTLEDSMVTRILDSVENAAASKPKIDRFITRFSRVYTPFVVLLAAVTAVVPSVITGDWNYWIYTAITFLVISCPCALVLSVPLAFFSGIGSGSKKGILFKGGAAIESLQNVRAVVLDKTGTITEGNFAVQEILTSGGFDQNTLLKIAGDCELDSSHPIAASIVVEAEKRGMSLMRPKTVQEISGKGICAVAEYGTVLCGNRKFLEENGVDLSGHRYTGYGTEVLLAVDGNYKGALVISDTVKKDAKRAVESMQRQNITPVMLTGDVEENAQAVGSMIGIRQIYAKLLPEEKLEKLKEIRTAFGPVMFVGDGINDAPVLAGADVGAAMGSGADAAIEAADVVFMTSAMGAIPQALAIARATGRIAKQNVVFALAIKALVMVLGLLGLANMWMAVFADTGVAVLCILNSVRILYRKW